MLMGFDPNYNLSGAEVRKCGVSVASLAETEHVFSDIRFVDITTSTTINSSASMTLAMYLVAAQTHGADWRRIFGIIQSDILNEFCAQNEYMRLYRTSMRRSCRAMPTWY
jgi:methylmalonyl-CoA mutase N-terminal domain/subunit